MISETKDGKNPKNAVKTTLMLVAAASLVIPIGIINAKVREVVQERAQPEVVASRPLTPEWATTIGQLKTFVETERGLKFKYDVKVALQSDKDFNQSLATDAEEYETTDPADSYIALKALGLIDDKLQLDSTEDPLQDGGTVGYYDSLTNQLVVNGEENTPFVRSVLVHELTHAIQDQNFNLYRDLDEYDESYLAFDSVVEGDATRIEQKYLESLNPQEQAQAAQEEESLPAGPESESVDVLSMLSGFPYEVGNQFVSDIFAAGGQPRVDKAFRSPPRSSEQILHPERYLTLQRPVEVETPDAQGDVMEEGVWGEVGLLTMFLGNMPDEQAWEAADGWGGDYFVAWKKGDTSCFRANMVSDSKTDKQELLSALKLWAVSHPGTSIKSGKTIDFRICSG